jgi:hypothetical protein
VTITKNLCAAATLWILAIRDWRCYGATLLWLTVWGAVQTANLSLVFTLGVAGLWCLRERALPAGGLVALMIAGKLFLWPLALWLVATRRWRATAAAVTIGALASAAAFAVVGFDRVSRVLTLLRGNVEDNGTKPYTIVAVVQQLGAPQAVGFALCWVTGAVVLAVAARAGIRGADAASLSLFLGAALLLSPVVWSHYLALLLVPVALARPRFSGLWLLPLPLWVCPAVDAALPQKLLLLGVGAAIVAICARDLMRATHPPVAAAAS